MSEHKPDVEPQGSCGANAAPYVLGALADEEHEAFRHHMDSCAVCREEVAALQVVASALPAAAPQMSAPPELKRRVMSSVREDVRRRDAATRANARPSGAGARAWTRWRPAFAALATAAALAVLVVVALAPGGRAGTRVIRAEVLVPRASASLSVSGGRAQLRITGMPQPSPGRVYEVWKQGSAAPQPTDALFAVTAGGDATVGVPGSVSGVKEVLVTSEPLGGSRVPTRPPVIVARVS